MRGDAARQRRALPALAPAPVMFAPVISISLAPSIPLAIPECSNRLTQGFERYAEARARGLRPCTGLRACHSNGRIGVAAHSRFALDAAGDTAGQHVHDAVPLRIARDAREQLKKLHVAA